jgi:hypothetical protein
VKIPSQDSLYLICKHQSLAQPPRRAEAFAPATCPRRREKLSEALARVQWVFRSAAAYGCQQAEAGCFWALYGLLTPQGCSALSEIRLKTNLNLEGGSFSHSGMIVLEKNSRSKTE